MIHLKNKSSGLFLALIFACITLTGCSSSTIKDSGPKHAPRHLDKVPDAVPKCEPLSRYGNRFKNKSNSYVALKKRYQVLPTSKGYKAKGLASWYGNKFHGKRTSSGEPYNMYSMTAAHKTLPLPTYARVTNTQNGKSVVVKINDRGPFHNNRIIDLSYVAAHKLGIVGKGTGHVEVVSIDPRDHGGKVPGSNPLTKLFSKSNTEPKQVWKTNPRQAAKASQTQKASQTKMNKKGKQVARATKRN